MTRYSTGKPAFFIDDRDGFRYPYRQAVWDGDTLDRSLRVHPDNADKLNPDIVLSRRVFNDAEVLKDPRDYPSQAILFAWPSADSTIWTADNSEITADQVYFSPL